MNNPLQQERILWLTGLTILLIFTCAFSQEQPEMQTIEQPVEQRVETALKSPPISLFADQRAFRLGDVVTILLMEYSSASNEASTNSDIQHLFEASSQSSGALDFIPGVGLKSGIKSDQKSKGATTRAGQLRGKLAARVVEMLPNGNVRLEGMRKVVVNGEEQLMSLTGIVRPRDILSDNSVYSYLIADASITYKGRGVVDQAAKPGILTRFINWLF